MNKVSIVVFLYCFLFTFPSYATILQMEEFYNPTTQQTLIFAHDFHYKIPFIDEPQRTDLVKAIRANKAHLISEQYEQLSEACSLSLGKNKSWVISEPQDYLLPMVYRDCKDQSVSVHALDFRKHDALLTSMFRICEKSCANYNDFVRCVQQPKVAELLCTTLRSCLSDAQRIIASCIQPYMQTMLNSKQDQAYRHAMQALFHDYTRCYEAALHYMNAHDTTSSGAYVYDFFHDMYAVSADGKAVLSDTSVYRTLKQASSKLLDVLIVQQLHALQDKRVLVVHAGSAHLHRVSHHLASLGFELRFQVSCAQHYRMFEDPEASMTHQKYIDYLQSIDAGSLVVDVNAFIQQCTTLDCVTAIIK